MKLAHRLRSVALSVIVSKRYRALRRRLADWRRRLTGKPHVVSVFLQIDDPYSYLLSHYLPALAEHYDIELRLYLSQALGEEFQPAPGLLAEYAVHDCRRVARELGVPFLDRGEYPPTELRVALADAIATSGDEEFLGALAAYWRGDAEAAARRGNAATKGAGDAAIRTAQAVLKKLGHYNSAMLHYGGEWYWGVDRLHYLTARLDSLGLARHDHANPQLASIQQAMRTSLPVTPPAAAKRLPPLEFFISMRSPYSYLSLQPVFEIADAYGIKLKIRLVLPMVMRGVAVPKAKLLYIVADTTREGERIGVPFGKMADPVGTGIDRIYAVHQYARSEGREREYLLQTGAAVWANAIDVATDEGLRKVTGKTGLFWPEASAALQNDDWRAEVETNREAMMASGSWGVPTLKMGEFVTWGQDRTWLLVRHLEDLCESEGGIVV
ncbi:MAG: DsbA family protein [Pseudomonadota bacterium]